MNCPACNRDLAITLSVCPSCGTMVNDSVREELALKISPLGKRTKTETREKPVAPPIVSKQPNVASPPIAPTPPSSAPVQSPAPIKTHTAEIMAKQTSPTLVEFQNKNAVLPEWRLQLQNAVRMRHENVPTETAATSPKTVLVTKGSIALKAEAVEQPEAIHSSNPKLENALRRIEESRQKYFTEEKTKPNLSIVQNQAKTFPYSVANKSQAVSSEKFNPQTSSSFITKPRQAAPLTQEKAEKFDTNKLPPISTILKSLPNSEKRSIEISPTRTKKENTLFEIKADENAETLTYEEIEIEEIDEEIDDRAPFALRFNAALFDLIIGSFLSVVLLVPFMKNGNLFTLQGLFAFIVTCSIVMFVYLTTAIGLMGKTFGMRLFSLEIIDVEENDYPTFHQAAVSSSVYLLSLALGGIGYLTFLLNDERRAAHDILSGTIVVKEY